MAQDRGLTVGMSTTLKNPPASSLAEETSHSESRAAHYTESWHIYNSDRNQSQLMVEAARQCEVEESMVEDLYPCTPLQEGLIALSVKTPGMYVSHFRYEIPPTTDLLRFKGAWNAVLTANPILRTRMIQLENGVTFQVVLKDSMHWKMHTTLDEQSRHSRDVITALGSPLFYLSLAPMPIESGNGSYLFVLTLHHSVYDGWSMPLLWDQVRKAYHGESLAPRPFSPFIRHLTDVQGGEDHWRERFRGIEAVVFPPLPSANYVPNPSCSFECTIVAPSRHKSKHTLSNMIQFAWAVILSHYTDSPDVVFGLTLNGRSADVNGIMEFTGPTIATVPIRVNLSLDKTVDESIADLQQQTIASHPFLHHGLQRIRKINADTSRACNFQSHLVIQPPSALTQDAYGGLVVAQRAESTRYQYFASFALVVAFHLSQNSDRITVVVRFDCNAISDVEARRLLEQVQAVLDRISSRPTDHVADIEVISEQDMLQLQNWNSSIPPPVSVALYDLVVRLNVRHPSKNAVCAWDGIMTYGDLDRWSSCLAAHLIELGVQPEIKVALCLEKSMWSIVALLAVLRAGGTCVLLDPGHPRSRIEDMVTQTAPALIVFCATHADLARTLSGHKIPITANFLQQLPPPARQLPVVKARHAAFILFTSGSTGRPKGIIMEHGNLSTSIASHGRSMNVGPHSRCLHFASYSFDASIYEIFNTLCFGGCLHVPSEHDRINRLGAFINQNKVNWAILTPSTLKIFQPEDIPSLKTVIIGGEAASRDLVDRWAGKVNLINGYGPAEATICTLGAIQPLEWKVGSMGRMAGSVGWIVDASNTAKLAAIGAIGELVIEGAVVTRGYLNEPEKTAMAYIQPPPWLQKFRPNGVVGRLYKSGDLVQYNSDGTFRFVGRKDTQVKLRGQRIELGEVEYHVKICFAGAADVIADVITPREGGSAPFLVSFIWSNDNQNSSLSENDDELFLEPTESFHKHSSNARIALSNSLPRFMVPDMFLPLRRLPVTRSDKANRLQLREACMSLSLEKLQLYSVETKSVIQAPSTDTERILLLVWARVLEPEATAISTDDDFFSLGGDSISAMQVVVQCADAGIKTSVAAIFEAKTISKLAARAEQIQHPKPVLSEVPKTECVLSPAQLMFFDTAGQDYDHFNQNCTYLNVPQIEIQKLKGAISWIVMNHPMLRTRFTQGSDGQWKQLVSGNSIENYLFIKHTVATIDDAKSLVQSDQKCLDIQDGPVFVCHVLNVKNDSQTHISLTAHHLVTDSVSWRILTYDLEDLLIRGREPSKPPVSFHSWARLQASYAPSALTPSPTLPDFCSTDVPAYWGIDRDRNSYGDASESGFELSEEETQSLVGRANEAFRTKPGEIIHAAVLQAFVATFHDRPAPLVHCEGHGREPLDPSIDLTRTVGLFTTMWPVGISVAPGDSVLETVKRTKDTRRSERYSYPQDIAKSRRSGPFEVLFKYDPGLTETSASALNACRLLDSELTQMSPNMTRFALVEIMAEVQDARLSVNFIFNRDMRSQVASIRDWIDKTKVILQSALHALAQHEPAFTLSDFPMLKYSTAAFDTFNRTVLSPLKTSGMEIEDAYPCSPMQEGMMISRAKNPGQYLDRRLWTTKLRSGAPVDIERLKESWYLVLQKHPLLRSISYKRPDQSGLHDQVVVQGSISFMCTILEMEDDAQTFLASKKLEMPGLTPQIRLVLCPCRYGSVACLMVVSHTIIDGISLQIIWRDLLLAYEGKLDSTPLNTFGMYVEHIQQSAVLDSKSQEHWGEYLSSAEPCILQPSLSKKATGEAGPTTKAIHQLLPLHEQIREFSAQHGLTMANTFQVAWAIVLRLYLNTNSVCFGSMISGRDAPIAGIQDGVGPFINMLILHLVIDAKETVLDLLNRNQREFAQNLAYQRTPLSEQFKAAKRPGVALFNTGMSVVKGIKVREEEVDLLFQDFNGADLTEYALHFNIALWKSSADIYIVWEYMRDSFSDEQVHNLTDAFKQALLSIIAHPRDPVGSLSLFSQLSRNRLASYTQKEVPAIDDYVDKLIEKSCLLHPSTVAVDAWDGSFTYEEINRLSSSVAAQLIRRGLKPNQYVPLALERSRWTPVGVLGVLKAGSAFILLDTSHPVERLQHTCHKLSVATILTSESNKILSSKLAEDILVLNDDIATGEAEMLSPNREDRNLEDAAYAIFTSVSTGRPRGTIIEHRSLATSAVVHGAALAVGHDSRVLQLSPYAFDVAILEHVTTLVMGGCICIPSDDAQRHNVPVSAAALRPNWIATTPSVARTLNPTDFKTLRTLVIVIGGEPLVTKELDMWRFHVDLRLAYGHSECTIVCFSRSATDDESFSRTIGICVGCTGWVVSPDDPSQLLPVGAIGELAVEGPIVGRGYVGEPEMTAASWFERPPWLAEFLPRSTSRLYRTGDLVRYVDNGKLQFMGRKDSQVKLRGHRIELSEVEHQLRHCWPTATDAVVELVVSEDGSQQPHLVAFIPNEDADAAEHHRFLAHPWPEFYLQVQQTQDSLNEELPDYMVPTLYLPLHHMPLTTDGIADRHLLRQSVTLLSQDELLAYNASSGVRRQVSSDLEVALQSAWSRVLNIVPEHIGINDSFFQLGGDSISAMQIAASCASQQLNVTVADIFRYKTISSIAKHITTAPKMVPVRLTEAATDTPFTLSPIQQMFFDVTPDGVNHYNLSLLFHINRPVGTAKLLWATNELVKRHHMLRARFRRAMDSEGAQRWEQSTPQEIQGSFMFGDHQITSLGESKAIMLKAQVSLDIASGPVFGIHSMTTEAGEKYLFILAHHLVVDPVSLRIICKDLEDLLTPGATLSPQSTSFQSWVSLQAAYAAKHLSPDSVITGSIPPPPPSLEYWGLPDTSNIVRDRVLETFVLDEEITRTLLGPANEAFQTQPVELLQAVLLYSFMHTFEDRPLAPTIFSEGHGREPWDPAIDLNNTVGWFTTMSPTHVQSRDLLDILRRTKDQRHQLRDNGWAYFASRYMNPQGRHRLQLSSPVEIIFNFTGHYQQLEREGSLFSFVDGFEYGALDVASDSPRFAIFEIAASVLKSRLQFGFFCNRHANARRPVGRWVANYERSLIELALTLPSRAPAPTLADYPFFYSSTM
ncbi:hypothetical protein F5Y16DRAFT_421452 [Xylariaceae sp. FL0255]|nr:hypothetical protein F5Y16DRAFT_421452 [Xylariaceae sp. FL0255]